MGSSKSKQQRREREAAMEARRARQAGAAASAKAAEAERLEAERAKLRLAAAPVLVAAAQGYLARKHWAELQRMVDRRAKIAGEVLETERSYVGALWACVDWWQRPLARGAAQRQQAETRQFAKAKKMRSSKALTKAEIQAAYADGKTGGVGGGGAAVASAAAAAGGASASGGLSTAAAADAAREVTERPPVEFACVGDTEVRALFSFIETIAITNSALCAQLEDRVRTWEWTSQLGEVFLEMMDFLKSYIMYVNNYNQAMDTLAKLMEDEEFAQWANETMAGLGGKTLESLLIMPVQRVPRYLMLMEDLCKHTPEGHIDHDDCERARRGLGEIAALINDKKREAENFQNSIAVHNRLEPPLPDLIQPFRHYIRQDECFDDSDKDKKPVMLFLFSDILLMTARDKMKVVKGVKQAKNRLVAHISLKTATLENAPAPANAKEAKKPPKYFELVTPKKTFTFAFKEAAMKDSFFKDISEQMDGLKKNLSTFGSASPLASTSAATASASPGGGSPIATISSTGATGDGDDDVDTGSGTLGGKAEV